MRLFQAALDTPLDTPFSATLSVHGLHFTVCAPSKCDRGIVTPILRWGGYFGRVTTLGDKIQGPRWGHQKRRKLPWRHLLDHVLSGLRWLKSVRVARLQSEFCTKDFFWATNFLTKNAPKFPPKFLSLYSVGQKNSRQIPAKFPTKFLKFPCEKKKKSPTSFCRSAGRKKWLKSGFRWLKSGPYKNAWSQSLTRHCFYFDS